MSSPQRRIPPLLVSTLAAILVVPRPRPALALHEALYACPNPDVGEAVCPTGNVGSTASYGAEEMAEDEQTLLDLFGEAAKELLTQHVIPPTDAECRWDWRHVRCEPFCLCSFRPLWGDFHLGRSCRLRDGSGEDSDGLESDAEWKGRETCHMPPDTPYAKAFQAIAKGAREATMKARKAVRVVAEKIQVKERLGKVKGRACTSWEERVNYDGKDMKQWQKKFCGLMESEDEIESEDRESMRREFFSKFHQQIEGDDEPQFEKPDLLPKFRHSVHQRLEDDEEPPLDKPREGPAFAYVHQQIKENEEPPLDEMNDAPKVKAEGLDEKAERWSDESETK